jgi:hypothetical protein
MTTIKTEVTPPGPAGLAHLKMVVRDVKADEVSPLARQLCSSVETHQVHASYVEASRVLTLQCLVSKPETQNV